MIRVEDLQVVVALGEKLLRLLERDTVLEAVGRIFSLVPLNDHE